MFGFFRVGSVRAPRAAADRSPSLAVLAGCTLGLLLLSGCSSLQFKYPMDKPISKKTFEPRVAPDQIELYYSTSRVARSVSSGGSHTTGGDDYYPPLVDSGSEEVARSFPVPGAPRDQPTRPFIELRKLRTNLILRETPSEAVPGDRWPDEAPQEVLPSKEMIDDGLGQLQEMAAASGADGLRDIFVWILVEESRFGVAGVYELSVIPRGIVLQGIAIRYQDP